MKKITFLVVTAFLLLSACSSGGAEGGSSEGAGGKLTIGTWGGDYEQYLKDLVEPELKNDYDLVYVPESTSARMTKVRIEAEGEGTYDVINLQDTTMQQLVNGDLLMKLDYSKIPNAENIREELKNPYFIPHIYSAATIVYNKKLVEEAPDSWEALWDPKYKGKVGVHTAIFPRYLFAAAAVEGVAESEEWDKAWDKLLSMSDNNPKFYTSQEQLATALQTGEIAMTVTWRARAVQWNDAGGDPIGSVIPKEGTFPTVFGTGIPKNAQNVEGAYDFLNAMLDPEAQAKFAENMGYVPTVTDAELEKEVKNSIAFSDEELERIMPISLEYITENYAEWKKKFDRDFAAQ
ncbi:PotD/PotF family extracellular solute-binding protein [Virgibacillus kekensis]|uniref:PotD/PotF family extracellular solute-binding protein n=1 Tax=Virgibacillus kekensis TaxID=202261 RepID=A0ABV9DIB6_9BACI